MLRRTAWDLADLLAQNFPRIIITGKRTNRAPDEKLVALSLLLKESPDQYVSCRISYCPDLVVEGGEGDAEVPGGLAFAFNGAAEVFEDFGDGLSFGRA
jgi:hypothetical protein